MHIKLLGMMQGIAYFLTSSHPFEEGCSSMEDDFALSTYPVLFHLASPLLKIHNNLDKQQQNMITKIKALSIALQAVQSQSMRGSR